MLYHFTFTFLMLIFFTACTDNAEVVINHKNFPKEKMECLKLLVFPPNEVIEKEFRKLYTFSPECPYQLEVTSRSGITCNSNHNYQKKATGIFPQSYLKMQLNKGKKILYSYYRDIPEVLTQEDIKSAFSRLEEDLSL